jgi:serine/threonine-protein phosphatase 2A regulatory subunit A
MIKLIPKISETALLDTFSKVFKDEQDSVRMHGIEFCVSFAQNMSSQKMSAPLIPYIKKFSEDRSWRIRYMVADKIMELA